ncbi:MAG: type IV pilin N-terminal domain-containing protein [Methanomicrobium sp.]|nr:type IV pilin N-terminal domain-containing protein [Methanomicrobium sp.]
MKSLKLSNEAVSPVVGVMLMLVVTLIIAAIVSGFAGSMVSSSSITPQAIITAEYSQANGMVITHAGGDSLPMSQIKFATMPGEVMGSDYLQFLYDIDMSGINYTASDGESKAIMNNATGNFAKSGFMPGEVLTISRDNCKDSVTTQAEIDALEHASRNNKYTDYGIVNTNAAVFWGTLDSDKFKYFSGYQFMWHENVGKYFYLIVTDENGATISKTKVTIKA